MKKAPQKMGATNARSCHGCRLSLSHIQMVSFLIGFTLIVMTPVATADDGEGEFKTNCGPVPPNEEMMKVLKPMTDLLLDCLPVFEKYNLKLSGMFISAEAICGGFDKCAPTGVVTSKFDMNSEETQCFLEIFRTVVPATFKPEQIEASARDLLACASPNLPLKKKSLFAVMHWYLAMTGL